MGITSQAPGFREKKAKDSPACFLIPGVREGPGSSVTTEGVCATAPSSPGWTHHSPRAGTPVCGGIGLDQGSPRAWLCAGRKGKVRHAWFKETGSDGDKQSCNPGWDQEEATPERGLDQGDPDCALGVGREERQERQRPCFSHWPCWGFAAAHTLYSRLRFPRTEYLCCIKNPTANYVNCHCLYCLPSGHRVLRALVTKSKSTQIPPYHAAVILPIVFKNTC